MGGSLKSCLNIGASVNHSTCERLSQVGCHVNFDQGTKWARYIIANSFSSCEIRFTCQGRVQLFSVVSRQARGFT